MIMTSKKKYKTRKVPVDVLRQSEGKVVTEHIFLRDMRMAKMFIKYMIKNANHLMKYEHDPSEYELIESELWMVKTELDDVEDRFRMHLEKDTGQ